MLVCICKEKRDTARLGFSSREVFLEQYIALFSVNYDVIFLNKKKETHRNAHILIAVSNIDSLLMDCRSAQNVSSCVL